MTIAEYIKIVNERFQLGLSKEHSYRGDLESLIRSLVSGVEVTNEPANVTDCGNPDYVITKGKIPVGYIEAKDIAKDLNSKQYKEQFDRYKKALDNLIITDYLYFQFFHEGELLHEIRIGEVIDGAIKANTEAFSEFESLIKDFCSYIGQTIRSSKRLAELMAGKARLFQHILERAILSDEAEGRDSSLMAQYEGFKDILIHDLTAKSFADIYAQTLAYGMFAARLNDKSLEDFSRGEAAELIPKSNPFLRKLFGYIAGPDIDERIIHIVDNLADIFRATDVDKLLRNFGQSTQSQDPIIHFYETFLSEYDPKLRKSRGVWYTPEPVVSFIVRAVDEVLKKDFNFAMGLADTSKTKIKLQSQIKDNRTKTGYKEYEEEVHRLQILDPATGTGTFLAEVVRFIYQNYFASMQGVWTSYVEQDLIPRLNGFELLMASYAMAHLKLGMLLEDLGYQSGQSHKRLNIYLTNSLEEHHPDTGTLFARWLSDEANEANHIKRDTPVMCIMGNPPYSGESANKGEWIMKLMEDYKREPDSKAKLKERNPKWINDDYVKFIRYGQQYIEKNGSGILAFITPHGFLDNPTFRGMRWHLLKTYDKIYTIDLHGNSKKKESCPDGSKDENVFDIQQGVAITLFIKKPASTVKRPTPLSKLSPPPTEGNSLAEVYHYDLYGKREEKYKFLKEQSLSTIPFVKLENKVPQYFMVQKDYKAEKKYMKGFAVNELFPVNGVGITTAHDNFVIKDDKTELLNLYKEFQASPRDKNYLHQHFNVKEKKGWNILDGYDNIFNSKNLEDYIQPISYRPFDNKFIFYEDKLVWRTVKKVMQHFIKGDNVGLIFRRQSPESNDLYLFISDNIIADGYIRSDNKGGESIAPLYLYEEVEEELFEASREQKFVRRPNLDSKIVKQISKGLGYEPKPIELLDYIYAVLHSPKYRETYKEFLKIDFPRVSYPKDKEVFDKQVALGSQLRQLHLLESPLLNQFITSYPVAGHNKVKQPHFEESNEKGLGKVFINDEQYFDNVPSLAWNFYIGGYQPAQKWLKDRKEKELNFEDILHYQRIILALTETDRLMQEIDKLEIE